MKNWARLADDRLRPARLCRPDDLPPDVPRKVRRAVSLANGRGWMRLVFFVSPALIILSDVAGMTRPFRLVLDLGLLAVLVPFALWLSGALDRGAATLCVRGRICPSCGYALENLDPAPDGCTVCPECGAAWRLTPPITPP